MKSTQKILLVLMVIFSLAAVIFAAIVILPNLAPNVFGSIDRQEGSIRVFIQAPPIVSTGSPFRMEITVQNDSAQVLEIDEIRLPQQLLEIAVVEKIFPGSLEQTDFDIQTTGFKIGFLIAPEASQKFEIDLKPWKEGDVIGDIVAVAGEQSGEVGFRLVIEKPVAVIYTSTPTFTPTFTYTPEPSLTPTAIGVPFQAVVKIATQTGQGDIKRTVRVGSGTIISQQGLILTNAHIVNPGGNISADRILIYLTQNPDQVPVESYIAEVVKIDEELDIALLQIVADTYGSPILSQYLNLPAVQLGDSDQLQMGDSINILGYPGIGGDTITLTNGDVSGFTSQGRYGDRAYIKTTATIAAGASGGIAVDKDGFMVAIPTQLGPGGDETLLDCRVLADTNGDGRINQNDTCVPVGGFINALRPINLALPMIRIALLEEESKPTGSLPLSPTETVRP